MAGRLLSPLPADVEAKIFEAVSENEIACSVRLVNRATAAHFRGRDYTSVWLSQPVPCDAFAHRCMDRDWIRSLTRHRRLQLVCLTAASGDLANLQVAVRAADLVLPDKVMETAAAAGHTHICQWLWEQGCPWGEVFKSAARAGRREVCEWLLASGLSVNWSVVCAALRGGHVGLAEWLWVERLPGGERDVPAPEAFAAVAEGCDLPTMQRLYMAWQKRRRQQRQQQLLQAGAGQDEPLLQGAGQDEPLLQDAGQDEPLVPPDRRVGVVRAAAGSPTSDWRDKVEWAERQGCRKTAIACAHAASRSDAVERLRWMRQRGYPLAEDAVWEAVSSGNAAALDFLLGEAGVACNEDDAEEESAEAAREGHLAVLQVLHTRGAAMVTRSCLCAAAEGGSLAVVEWLVGAFGLGVQYLQKHAVCPALESGNMELLTWLEERGCDFGGGEQEEQGCDFGGGVLEEWGCGFGSGEVVMSKSEAALEWQVARGRRMPTDGSPYLSAVESGDLAAVACLCRLGCPWGPPGDPVFHKCIAAGRCSRHHLPVLQRLAEEGCPVDWSRAVRDIRRSKSLVHEDLRAWVVGEAQRRGLQVE